MSYGLQTFDAAGRVQLDTTRASDSGMIVIDAGTASTVSNVPSYARIFVNIQPSSGNIGFVAHSYDYSTSTVSFYGTATSEDGPLDQALSVNYIIAVPASTQTYSGNDYGLQCLNGDGDVLYDSRYLSGDGGFGILGYSEPQEHDGDLFATTGPTNNLIVSDKTTYIDVANFFVGSVGNNTGNKVKGRYIVFANNFSANYTSVESRGYRESYVSSSYFVGTLDGIYFWRLRAGPQYSHIAHANPTNILYGEQI
jgi:hypothetical protein